MTDNKQLRNVGNLGDILKHAALTSLVKLLHAPGRRLLSVDTHAFQLEAPCRNPAGWLDESRRECSQYPALLSYIERQSGVGETPSRYRCSSGLVLDVWRALEKNTPTLILAESDPDTKARLAKQLKIEQVEPLAVLEDAKELPALLNAPEGFKAPNADVMYALVDPFVLEQAPWVPIRDGIARLAQSLKAKTAIVQVFTFDQAKDQIEWRDAPSGFKGPIATMHRRPYHLATYATEEIIEGCARVCASLGWRVEKAGADRHLHTTIRKARARLDDDPIASLLHQRRFLERVVQLASEPSGLEIVDEDAVTAINALASRLSLNQDLIRSMHWVRQRGNDAAHGVATGIDSAEARRGLHHCGDVARWFRSRFGHDLKAEEFEPETGQGETLPNIQLQREQARQRKWQSTDREYRRYKAENQELRKQLEQRSAGTPSISVRETADMTELRWVYFATPSKANRSETYELAKKRGVVCSHVKNATGSFKPNVKNLRPGDLMLLAYGKDGEYEPELYLTVEEPPNRPSISVTKVMYELPNELGPLLRAAGYSEDPSLGVFTGFRVTLCRDLKGQIRKTLRKPAGNNYLRTWKEVREANDESGL